MFPNASKNFCLIGLTASQTLLIAFAVDGNALC